MLCVHACTRLLWEAFSNSDAISVPVICILHAHLIVIDKLLCHGCRPFRRLRLRQQSMQQKLTDSDSSSSVSKTMA